MDALQAADLMEVVLQGPNLKKVGPKIRAMAHPIWGFPYILYFLFSWIRRHSKGILEAIGSILAKQRPKWLEMDPFQANLHNFLDVWRIT